MESIVTVWPLRWRIWLKYRQWGLILRKNIVTVLTMSVICTFHHLHFGFYNEISSADVSIILHFRLCMPGELWGFIGLLFCGV
jgi:hypothetical protein